MGKRIKSTVDFSKFVWTHYKQGYKDAIEKHTIPVNEILSSWSRFTIAVAFSTGVQVLFFSNPPVFALLISIATISFLDMFASEMRYAHLMKHNKYVDKLLIELKELIENTETKKTKKGDGHES